MADIPEIIPRKIDYKTNPFWLKAIPITLGECKNGSKYVEKITADEFFGRKKMVASSPAFSPVPKKDVKFFKFGKYRGQSYREVEIQDPRYMEWCRENIKNFNG